MHQITRSLAVVAVALTVATTTAHAQATGGTSAAPVVACGPGPANPSCENVPRIRSVLFEGIELTKAQWDAVDAITRRYRALHSELNEQHLEMPVYHAQLLGLRTRERAEKRKLLTALQQPRFDANADSLRKVDEQLLAEARRRAAARQKHDGETPRP